MARNCSKRLDTCCDLSAYLSPRLFKALGDSTRVALLARLAEAGRACTVGEMAREATIDVSVVSRHLAILREAGVIECLKRGREVWCRVRIASLARTLRELADALETCCPPEAPPAPAIRERSTR